MFNKATLIGNLGADPEIRKTQDGRSIANFSLATSESWKDKNTGERQQRTEWHRVVIFSEGLCKIAEQYLHKGSKVLIEGTIKTRKWQDQSGQDKYSTEIVLQGFDAKMLLLDKAQNGATSPDDYGTQSSGQSTGSQPSQAPHDVDDEIPF